MKEVKERNKVNREGGREKEESGWERTGTHFI